MVTGDGGRGLGGTMDNGQFVGEAMELLMVTDGGWRGLCLVLPSPIVESLDKIKLFPQNRSSKKKGLCKVVCCIIHARGSSHFQGLDTN